MIPKELQPLIRAGQLDSIVQTPEAVIHELDIAKRHYATARLSLTSDPEGAFQLLYDSARKALQALLAAHGYRVRKPPRGNHYTYVLVARTSLVNQEIWLPLNWMRELRNQTEYFDPARQSASEEDCIQALVHVARMLEDVESRLLNYLK